MDESKNSVINYSIIIPHKNIPDLLQRCLNSIPRRDDVQIIVVDDNSDPAKVDFNKFPGVGERCVEVYFTKEGKGAGYARNVGLKHAVGKWLLFADADDFFNDCINECLNKYKDADADIIFFSANSVFSDTLKSAHRHSGLEQRLCSAIKDGNYDILRYRCYGPTSKFLLKSFIDYNKIKFDEVLASNDVMFSVVSGHLAQKIIIVNIPIYCMTIRPGSLEHHADCNIYISRIIVGCRLNKYLAKINKIKYWYNANLYWLNVLFHISKAKSIRMLIYIVINTPIKILFKHVKYILK